jgi:hypothetical protein
MKEKKLRIGDKIRWNTPIGGGVIYTILDIDTTRPTFSIGPLEVREDILFQWRYDGIIHHEWGHSYEDLNLNLNKGGIIILERDIEPIRELLKFSLV